MTALFHLTGGMIVAALVSVQVLAFCGVRTFLLAEGGFVGVARWRRRTERAGLVALVLIVAAGVLSAVALVVGAYFCARMTIVIQFAHGIN